MNAVPNTPYPELPWVLDALVAGVRAVIADDLVGVYLVGSLATGDFDLDSDVDFLVVTRQELADAVIPRLQAMHTRIHGLALAHTHQCVGQAFVNCARFSAGQDAGPVRFFLVKEGRAPGVIAADPPQQPNR